MPINPITGLEEEDEYTKLFAENDAKRKALDEASSGYDTTGAVTGALASLAAGFQGKDSLGAVNQIQNQRRQSRADESSALDKWKQGKLAELSAKRDQVKAGREDEKYSQDQEKVKRESDVASQDSMMAQQLASKMVPGRDFSKMSASQINQILPSLSKIYEVEQKKLDRGEARGLRNDLMQQKLEEKEQGLKTPYGLANTLDDAKQLKSAHESKQNFDAKIQEMIDLRKEYGSEYLNREAVDRGKQLAKDLLLEYKNMAKLGVLSQSDEAIINAIIPKDPLANDWAPGQDPILNNLTKFKGDSDRDFNTRVTTRTRDGINKSMAGGDTKKVPVKTQTNAKTGEKRIVFSDGSIEIVPKVAGGM